MKAAPGSRGVLTLAYGHKRFVEQAKSLGLSLELHAPQLPRAIVTDSADPELRTIFTEVIPYCPGWGSGVRQKIYLDRYSPYEETLFVDSDCLALGNLDAFWTAFAGQYFGVPGYRYLRKGSVDPYIDVDRVLEHFRLSALPKFNGGTYYFTRSAEATAFFDTARGILDNWRELGLSAFRRNGPGDEAVYSIAMAIHELHPTYMGAGGMWTPCGYKGPLHLDALRGNSWFEKEGEIRTPEIIHFPGEYCYAFPYARERAKLRGHLRREKISRARLAGAFGMAFLWQCSRRSEALSKLARNSVRAWRNVARAVTARSRAA
jgi:hypothetical protein